MSSQVCIASSLVTGEYKFLQLGELPGFGRGREEKTERSNHLAVWPGERNHLDSTLDSLLGSGDDSGKPRGNRKALSNSR